MVGIFSSSLRGVKPPPAVMSSNVFSSGNGNGTGDVSTGSGISPPVVCGNFSSSFNVVVPPPTGDPSSPNRFFSSSVSPSGGTIIPRSRSLASLSLVDILAAMPDAKANPKIGPRSNKLGSLPPCKFGCLIMGMTFREFGSSKKLAAPLCNFFFLAISSVLLF